MKNSNLLQLLLHNVHMTEKKSDQFVLKLNKDDWTKELMPHADRGRLSTADIFYFCAATIKAGVEIR